MSRVGIQSLKGCADCPLLSQESRLAEAVHLIYNVGALSRVSISLVLVNRIVASNTIATYTEVPSEMLSVMEMHFLFARCVLAAITLLFS